MPTTPDNDDAALRALYRSRSPEPPAALDDAIRAAAREAIASEQSTRGPDGSDEAGSRPTRWRVPVWAGAAAAVGFAAVLLPGVLRQPTELEMVTVDSEALSDDIDTGLSPGTSATAAAPTPRTEPADQLAAAERALDAADDGHSSSFAFAEMAPARVARFQGRFRPDSDVEEAITVTITEEAVIVNADWSVPTPCSRRLVVPHTSTAVAVEQTPARPAPVGLRIVEADGSASTVRCTPSGWFVERTFVDAADQ